MLPVIGFKQVALGALAVATAYQAYQTYKYYKAITEEMRTKSKEDSLAALLETFGEAAPTPEQEAPAETVAEEPTQSNTTKRILPVQDPLVEARPLSINISCNDFPSTQAPVIEEQLEEQFMELQPGPYPRKALRKRFRLGDVNASEVFETDERAVMVRRWALPEVIFARAGATIEELTENQQVVTDGSKVVIPLFIDECIARSDNPDHARVLGIHGEYFPSLVDTTAATYVIDRFGRHGVVYSEGRHQLNVYQAAPGKTNWDIMIDGRLYLNGVSGEEAMHQEFLEILQNTNDRGWFGKTYEPVEYFFNRIIPTFYRKAANRQYDGDHINLALDLSALNKPTKG